VVPSRHQRQARGISAGGRPRRRHPSLPPSPGRAPPERRFPL
ncbi:MAG: hypothetical protein AVDCRST_MAG19-2373, partial [uncultured Thermomicrobiales bacterium]